MKEEYFPGTFKGVASFQRNQEIFLTLPGIAEEVPMMLQYESTEENTSCSLWFGENEKILDDYSAGEIIGYGKEESKWCEDNEKDIWNAIIESNHLYSKENITYIKYLNEAPYCSALNGDVPAEIGKWIGYKIVAKYIDDNNINSLKKILSGEIKTIEILKSYN